MQKHWLWVVLGLAGTCLGAGCKSEPPLEAAVRAAPARRAEPAGDVTSEPDGRGRVRRETQRLSPGPERVVLALPSEPAPARLPVAPEPAVPELPAEQAARVPAAPGRPAQPSAPQPELAAPRRPLPEQPRRDAIDALLDLLEGDVGERRRALH